jgi:hypothetical protein
MTGALQSRADLVCGEQPESLAIEGNRAPASASLRRGEDASILRSHHLLDYRHSRVLEIDISPSKPEPLSATHAGHREQAKESQKGMGFDRV